MKKVNFLILSALLVVLSCSNLILADDIEFSSFEEAEAAAKRRAAEYQKKMDEHLKQIQSDWEKQQKDLGESGASPDITKITSSSDGNKSSDNDAQKKMENAVNTSVNKMKDMMITSATPNTTGFAGGGAGYQWSVKFKNGKYVLSDSYNEAAFGTGDKKEKDPEPDEPEAKGSDEDEDSISDTKVAIKPDSSSDPEEPSEPSSGSSSGSPSSPADSSSLAKADPAKPADSDAKPASTGSAPEKPGKPEEKPLPGIDPAPTKLPDPAVRMVIQHPTDFSEEVFPANTNSEAPVEFSLSRFKIPEDTRVKIALELSKEVDPAKVALVVTDEEGKNAPVASNKTKNYRHLFRVPSEDQYYASVVVNEGTEQKEIMKVKIPVVKVDFDSRTIDDTRRKQGSEGLTNSAATSHSSSDSDYNHSSFGKSQQVDLSDLYSDPQAGSEINDNQIASSNAGSSSESDSSGNSSEGDGSSGSESGYSSSDSSASNSSGSGSSASNSSGSDSSGTSADISSNESGSDSQVTGSDSSASSSNGSGSDSENPDSSDFVSASSNKGGSSSSSDSSSSGNTGSGASYAGSGSESGDDDGNLAGNDGQNTPGDRDSNYSGAGESQGAAGTGDGSSGPAAGSSAASSAAIGNDKENSQEGDSFVMALSMQAVSKKIYQSFDFIDEKSPVSASIPAGTEVTFSMSFANNVDPESVKIELDAGKGKVAGDLKTWGEAFAYVFDKPAQASFMVSGKVDKKSFSYRLNIPVK